jgi:hypothetical protein
MGHSDSLYMIKFFPIEHISIDVDEIVGNFQDEKEK